jgi:hypothetical protein
MTHSEETKLKMRESHKTQIPWNKGLKTGPLSPDHIARSAAGRIGKPRSPESKAKQAATMKGRVPWNKGKQKVKKDE